MVSRRALEIGLVMRFLRGGRWRSVWGTQAEIVIPSVRFLGLPLMPGVPERATHDYVRNGTTNLYAALDVASGQVITEMTPRHRAEEFRRFLNLIERSVPAHLDVHGVIDNSSTQ